MRLKVPPNTSKPRRVLGRDRCRERLGLQASGAALSGQCGRLPRRSEAGLALAAVIRQVAPTFSSLQAAGCARADPGARRTRSPVTRGARCTGAPSFPRTSIPKTSAPPRAWWTRFRCELVDNRDPSLPTPPRRTSWGRRPSRRKRPRPQPGDLRSQTVTVAAILWKVELETS